MNQRFRRQLNINISSIVRILISLDEMHVNGAFVIKDPK